MIDFLVDVIVMLMLLAILFAATLGAMVRVFKSIAKK